MGRWAVILMLLYLVISCENTTGQYRHDPTHHDKTVSVWLLPEFLI